MLLTLLRTAGLQGRLALQLFDPCQLFPHGLNMKQVFNLQRTEQKRHMSLTFHAQ